MPMSESAYDAVFGSAWHVDGKEIKDRMTYSTSAASPSGVVTPTFIGKWHFDTAAAAFYISTGGGALAAFSYTLYLIHYPVIYLITHGMDRHRSIDIGGLLGYVGLLAISLFAAYLLFLAFECHTNQVRNLLYKAVARQGAQ